MIGTITLALLVGSLAIVQATTRRRPLSASRPLDVDEGLPLPEIGQASTVFSLTALFGAYLGIYLVLGWPALFGLAMGTGFGLLFVRSWLTRQPTERFEEFLFRTLIGARGNAVVIGLLLIGVQCAFAASELLILRDIARDVLGFRDGIATLIALALGVIGYYYVLFGGYRAVFRTDILQFTLVALMGIGLLLGATATQPALLEPRTGYWQIPTQSRALTYGYQMLVAFVMGAIFIVASPDAWKRVAIVVANTMSPRRFLVFMTAGIAPFVLLVPMASRVPHVADGPTRAGAAFAPLASHQAVFVAVALGLIASFMSAFTAAVLNCAQVGLLLYRAVRPSDELPRFHGLMALNLLICVFVFVGLHAFGNAYLLASALLGPYAVIGGLQFGTRGHWARLRDGHLLWIVGVGLIAWFLVLSGGPGVIEAPTTYQLNAVPYGIALCLATAVYSRLASVRGPQ